MFYSSTAYPSTHLFKNCFDPIPKGTPARWLGVGLSQGRVWRRRGGWSILYPWAHLPQGTLARGRAELGPSLKAAGGYPWAVYRRAGAAWYPGADRVSNERIAPGGTPCAGEDTYRMPLLSHTRG